MSLLLNAFPTAFASFSASFVECVEALTVVLAVGSVRGWRWALIGATAAVACLILAIGIFGQAIAAIPIGVAQLVVGTLLLMFGLRWLRKAILRYVGAIALHDESATYDKQRAAMAPQQPSDRWDKVAFQTSFKIVMLEGIEVVFIVIAIGANGRLLGPASLGAILALVGVVILGLFLHRPLARVPENLLKFVVGVLLAAFGTLWVGEGLGLRWPGGDLAVLALVALHVLVGLALVFAGRMFHSQSSQRRANAGTPVPSEAALMIAVKELWGLVVEDGFLAAGIAGWVAMLWLGIREWHLVALPACYAFVLGLGLLLVISVGRAPRPAIVRP